MTTTHTASSAAPNVTQIAADQLKAIIEKIERLEAEKAQIAEFIRDTMAEAKSQGFDTKVLRQVLRLRKMEKEDVEEQEELLTLYCHALGM